MTPILTVYTVFDHPRDRAEPFVVRAFHVGPTGGPRPGDIVATGATLEAVRRVLRARVPGLTHLARHADDDPVIVETWI